MERTSFRSTLLIRSIAALAIVFATLVFTADTSFAQVNSPNPAATNVPPAAPTNAPAAEARDSLMSITSGLAFYALLTCVGGICISSALWAIGSNGANPGTELAGKRGVVLCCAAAFVVGALPAWLGYLDNMARQPDIDPNGVGNYSPPIGR